MMNKLLISQRDSRQIVPSEILQMLSLSLLWWQICTFVCDLCTVCMSVTVHTMYNNISMYQISRIVFTLIYFK